VSSVGDDVVFPRYLSLVDLRCELSASGARIFNSHRVQGPGETVKCQGWGVRHGDVEQLESRGQNFFCFIGGESRIIMSAGLLEGA
jgi:hypothetical protein